jgi:OOP family OmpA-OmpF porin
MKEERTAMATNILELLKNEFNDDLVGKLGKFVGEDATKTKSALGSIFPAVLGALINKGSTSQGASDILGMIAKGGFGEDTLKGLSNAFAGGDATKNLLNIGTNLLSGIFGDRVAKVIEWVGGASGVGKNAASSLLGLAVPAVLGHLGKVVKGANLNATGLMSLLGDQSGYLKNLAPAGLAGALGLSSLPGPAKPVSAPAPPSYPSWKSFIPLILLLALQPFMYRACSAPPVKPTVEKAAVQVAAEATRAIDKLGKFLAVKLPGGIELNVPEFGVEKKLIAFIEDAGKPVDKTTWFSFDRLEFETGSSNLKPSSAEQLKNIAQILKAYPKVGLKIGGYTDNVGNPAANLTLSQKRADSTMQELVKLGVDAKRLEAEGYGDKYPVADNMTEEGRQKNRRIDLRVTRK